MMVYLLRYDKSEDGHGNMINIAVYKNREDAQEYILKHETYIHCFFDVLEIPYFEKAHE